MAVEFRLPDIGEGLEEAEIVEWLVAEGERVERDQPVVEVLTDKSQAQLPAPTAGTVARLAFAPGDMAHVGDVLLEIDDGRAAQTAAAAAAPAPSAAPGPPASATSGPERDGNGARTGRTPAAAAATTPNRPTRPKASPATRKRAVELGVDLATVDGTGPGGRILMTDVEEASSAPAPLDVPAGAPPAEPPGPATVASVARPGPGLGQMDVGTHPLRGIRRVTAANMARAWSEIPHIWAHDDLDATELLAARARLRASGGDATGRLTPLAFFVKAVARALRAFPLVNASIDPDAGTITVHPDVHVGIAVASPRGLVVPVVRHADRRGLVGLAAEIARLTDTARAGALGPEEMRGGTCTITNYGSLGGRYGAPLIVPPQVAIVGFGAVAPRPWVVEDEVVVRPVLPVSLAVDHRLIDGDLSTAFHRHVMAGVADPTLLLLEV